MPKQTIEIEVPEGYELTGEYRTAKTGDITLNRKNNAELWISLEESTGCYLILRRVKQWRPATVEDVVRAIKGNNVEVRFSNNGVVWLSGYLHGYRKDTNYSWLSKTGNYTHCEVLCD